MLEITILLNSKLFLTLNDTVKYQFLLVSIKICIEKQLYHQQTSHRH